MSRCESAYGSEPTPGSAPRSAPGSAPRSGSVPGSGFAPGTDTDLGFGPIPESYVFPPMRVGPDSSHSNPLLSQQQTADFEDLSQDDDPIQPLDISSGSIVTFAHFKVSQNRLYADDLERGRCFDKEKWTPLFVTGALQLPGTLAYIVRVRSGLHMQQSMFPAIRNVPDLLPVHGTVILGRGGHSRKSISNWHGKHYQRILVSVQVALYDGAIRTLSALCWEDTTANGLSSGWVDQEATDHGAMEVTARGVAQSEGCSDLSDNLGDGSSDGKPWAWEDTEQNVDW